MQNTTLVAALFLSALAVFLQALAVVGMWLYFRKMQAMAADMKQRLDPLIRASQEIVADSREPLHKILGDLAQTSGMIRERTSDVNTLLIDVVEKSRSQVTRLDEVLGEIAEKSRAQVEHIDQMISVGAGNVDALLSEVLDKARVQVARVDLLLTDLVQKIETTSDLMQRRALAPINEIAAVVKGLQAGLQFFFTRRPYSGRASEPATQDEQLFI